MKKIWELNSNETYYVDDMDNIYETSEDYCNIIQNGYGGIKDNLEDWLDQQCEENLKEMTGMEIIQEMIAKYEEYIRYLEEKKE